MGSSPSKEETENINAEAENKEEKVEKKKEEDDEEDLASPINRIFYLLRKQVVDVPQVIELCKKEGEGKVDLNKPDLPPVIDPNADPKDPMIIRLKERIAKKTYLGDYPMHILVGRPEKDNTPELLGLVKFFFLREHSINCRNKLGSTPLHRACAAGNVSMAKELIQWGAQVDDVNDMQLSCLSMACYAGHTEVVKLLLANGCAKHIHYKCRYGIAPKDYVLKDEIYQLLRAAATSSSSGKSSATSAAAALIKQASNKIAEGDAEHDAEV